MAVSVTQTKGKSLSSVEWSVCWWRCEHGKPLPHRQITGEGRNGFWQLVADLLSSAGEVWCFSWQANADMTEIGLWDRIEEGTLRIQDRNTDKSSYQGDSSLPVVSDYMMLHDPPFMVRLAVPGRPGRMVVVDLRNYGISTDCQHGNAQRVALSAGSAASSLLQSLSSACGPSLQATAASTAFAWLRKSYLHHTVLVHTHDLALHLERDAIHGGRCECYHIGTVPEKCAHLDVRSAYPAVAMTTELPCRLLHYGEACEPRKYPKERGHTGVIADVTVHVTRPVAPYIKDGLTVYPVGRFRTVVCGPELSLIQTFGRVLRWNRWATYELDLVLAGFETALWNYREEAIRRGDKGADELYKRLMNGVIGKFAQKGRFWANAPDLISPMPYGTWYRNTSPGKFECCRSVAWTAQRLVDRGESADSCPAIAAWVYSEARVRLWRLIEKAGRENIYYVDTDSLFCNASGGRNLAANPSVEHGTIGGLRDVDGFDVLQLFGVKDYMHGGKRVKAGPSGYKPADILAKAGEAKPPKPKSYRHGVVSEQGRVSPWEVWE